MAECAEHPESIRLTQRFDVNGCASEAAVREALWNAILEIIEERKSCEGGCPAGQGTCRVVVTDLIAVLPPKAEQKTVQLEEITAGYTYRDETTGAVTYGGTVEERTAKNSGRYLRLEARAICKCVKPRA